MKLAFSTLGCPSWSWDEIFATAKDMGIDGIEIRGMENEMYAPKIRIFSEANREATLARMKGAGLEFSALTSGAALGMPDSRENGFREAIDYIDLAARLGVAFVRVMPTFSADPMPADLELAKKLYLELCDYAAQKGTCVLMETNGLLANSLEMKKFMEGTNPSGGGVLWDIHHPYRFYQESPEATYANIGQYVKYTHVKDSVMHDGKVSYRMMGYGDVPVFDTLKVLGDNGYKGYITLEWVKRWNQELQEPGIVFYHYMNYMEYLISQLES